MRIHSGPPPANQLDDAARLRLAKENASIRAADASRAVSESEAKIAAVNLKTARLRALRLAREETK